MSSQDSPSGRRSFLRGLVTLAPSLALGGCASSPAPRPTAVAFAPAFFTSSEWAFLCAACARLIPADELGPGAVELGVPEFIDRQLEGPFGHAARWYMQGPFFAGPPELGYQSPLTPREVYRAGIEELEAHCRQTFDGASFAGLSAARQDALLAELERGTLELESVPGTAFFAFLLQNTKEGYLADPIHGGNRNLESWKLIGFPGARADYADWVDRPGVRYPLGPVSISGRRG
jgi:gluconate 2-dehydrogenase gamma chain